MQVHEVMSRAIRSVSPDAKVMEVASIMCLYRIPGIPVVADDGELVGIIAEKDVLHSLFPKLENLMEEGMGNVDLDKQIAKYKDVLALSVSDLMTRNPITVSPDMHVLRAASVMVRHRFRRLPVAHEGMLVGMLSLGDLHKAIFHLNVATKKLAKD
ncbi:CBS domain-containing protein [Candidatus Thiosymbion oneisti]|uniref:CBS domain-containing protein n=1 Tax=Candidatus Thiosymbion oneisti TaxID=589554 RepID=UPI000B7C9D14|nr:CBS domain-containing protein [Candidatus Thiosymbion oneisti]